MINTSISFIFHIAKSVRETDKRRTYAHKSIYLSMRKICLNERRFPEENKLGIFFSFFFLFLLLLNFSCQISDKTFYSLNTTIISTNVIPEHCYARVMVNGG